jgi:hypothetical protein
MEMAWKPGESGNPRGKPPKARALTEQLKRAIKKPLIDIDGKKKAGNLVLGRILHDLIVNGEAMLPNGKTMVASPKDYVDVIKWLYAQVDGPPKAELDVNLPDGKQIEINVIEIIRPEETKDE